ncbi:hypothetical protein AB6E22_20610 [Vibrio cyclitrophicus]
MLENIAYLGHELTSVDFKLLSKQPEGEGFYNYSVEVLPDVSITTEQVDEGADTHQVTMAIKSSTNGFSGNKEDEEDKESVFTLDVEFTVSFELQNQEQPTADSLEKEQWFFVNFAHVASKEITSSILDNSVLKGAYLPSHRIDQRD